MGERYDAFISYSRQDKVFAELLENALESFKLPSDLDVPQRYLRIFRDESDFTGVDYQTSLDKHLKASSKLIVVCSPAARTSPYVNDEIRRFVSVKGPEDVVPILLWGIPNNEAKTGQEFEQAFPIALCEALRMPLSVDYRGFNHRKDKVNKSRFEDPWFTILANLYDKSRDEIEQREKKRQAYQRSVTLALGGFVISLVLGPVWLWQQGYNVEQAMLKIKSLVASVHVEPKKMVLIPAGSFQMGEVAHLEERWRKPHPVTIKPFVLGIYEVTFNEYDRFAITKGRPLPSDPQGWGRGHRPVINVSWEDAKAYAAWLSKQTGKHYRLPTEAEWEYAARSGAKQEIWAGTSEEAQLKEYAVFGSTQTVEVGTKRPNGFGLYDMSGNVWEWVEDCAHKTYDGAPEDGSAWLETHSGDCDRHVLRGGSWYNKEPEYLRASNRLWSDEINRFNVRGFRLAQDSEP